MFGDRGFRVDAEVPRDLSVRWFVTVLCEKAGNVVEDFFLALRSRQHLGNLFVSRGDSNLASANRQAFWRSAIRKIEIGVAVAFIVASEAKQIDVDYPLVIG